LSLSSECEERPCQHGATCEDGIKLFTCHCHGGYEGLQCETDIAECASGPCRNNGTCLERSQESLYDASPDSPLPALFQGPFNYSAAAGFECICPPGFEGFDCSVDIDECAPRPCYNGRCVDLFNHFKCECHDGYKGESETELPPSELR
jgi:protein crumbs